MLSEEEKQSIRAEARDILDNFGSALTSVKIRDSLPISSDEGFRKESEGIRMGSDFRKRMLTNAPKHTEDSIVAEKALWN